jgi:rhodanese-related sulfurtransferase
MTVPELHERWEDGHRPQVLDVRERAEWEAGHIPGSVFVPYHAFPMRDRSSGARYSGKIETTSMRMSGPVRR